MSNTLYRATVAFGIRWLIYSGIGANFATHPTFPFMIFNMLIRSENRRISYLRMEKASFRRVEEIVRTLTPDRVARAEEEYRETRRTTDGEISFLMRELNAFGHRKHMSNEERLLFRRRIKSLCLKHGMPCIWFTINPNDLTNEVNMKLTASRVAQGPGLNLLIQKFRDQVGRIQHVVRDPVSSATFFHREIELFFKHYTPQGVDSIFGNISCYFGCIETNDRGALHLHGFLWLDANIELPNLFSDIAAPGGEQYAEEICEYIDSVFCEVSILLLGSYE